MKIRVLTLFPEAFASFVGCSMIKRAQDKGYVEIDLVWLRDFAHDKHKTCDDRPFGGGPGMLMKPGPIFEAVDSLYGSAAAFGRRFGAKGPARPRFVLMTPQGRRFDQKLAVELSKSKELVFLCGHYEGIDQRVADRLVTDEISIGDYVLTQGELAAMVVMDAAIRLVKGVVGNEASKSFESFDGNLLEYPQYTRPASYRGMQVPEVLLGGDHRKIEQWRSAEAARKTRKNRPDLLKAQR
ncbi:MAG: tRNA (guanosine(37)-N1)-methyltransferase TrmD [Candidatus Omnitrophota bacterium]